MSELSDLLQRANRLTLSTRAIEAEAARRSHVISHSTISKYLKGRHGEPTHQVLAAMVDPTRSWRPWSTYLGST